MQRTVFGAQEKRDGLLVGQEDGYRSQDAFAMYTVCTGRLTRRFVPLIRVDPAAFFARKVLDRHERR